jgi:hypothetical protein
MKGTGVHASEVDCLDWDLLLSLFRGLNLLLTQLIYQMRSWGTNHARFPRAFGSGEKQLAWGGLGSGRKQAVMMQGGQL